MSGRNVAGDWSTCDVHGKRTYRSRKAARQALKAHPEPGVRPYRCDVIDGAWHLGHLPYLVKDRGAVAADSYFQTDRERRTS